MTISGLQSFAVWKNTWLPMSETFVADQISAIPGWRPVKIGLHNLSEGLATADYAPYPYTLKGKSLRLAFGVRPLLGTYEKLLDRENCRLVHAHFGSGGIHCLPLAGRSKLPLVTTFHGADTTLYGSKLPFMEAWYRRGLKDLFDRGTRLLAASRYLADRLVQNGAPASKVEVLYTGTRPVPKIQVEERRGVIFVGRLIEIKGLDHLLRAFSALPPSVTKNVPLTVVGDGPSKQGLVEDARKLGINARFLGWLPPNEIAAELARHSIFCGPSLPSPAGTREGLGTVFLGAALQELPVVAYASGGVREAVQDGVTGILVEENDVHGLAKALEHLVVNPQLGLELGSAGRSRVLESFNLYTQSGLLGQIYEDVAKQA